VSAADPVSSASGFEIARDGPTLLVVGVDESPTSRNALAYAVGMARRQQSNLVVVTVAAPVSLDVTTGMAAVAGVPLPSTSELTLPAEIVKFLDEMIPERWEHVVRVGEPAHKLAAVADELRADAIVVGRSRSPTRHVLGSVAARLVRHARTPVIVVP
jgi:nucleotide-binding universal stress UspA family protein